jgi:hypothetical protein
MHKFSLDGTLRLWQKVGAPGDQPKYGKIHSPLIQPLQSSQGPEKGAQWLYEAHYVFETNPGCNPSCDQLPVVRS